MNKDQFQKWLSLANIFKGLATDNNDFWTGYARGLRRLYHGEKFGTKEEHEVWFSITANERDLGRRARGAGYRSGLEGVNPQTIFAAGSSFV